MLTAVFLHSTARTLDLLLSVTSVLALFLPLLCQGMDYELPEGALRQLRDMAGDVSMKFRYGGEPVKTVRLATHACVYQCLSALSALCRFMD